ncbi:MAG: hypothetical protein WCL23_01155 [Candidatus Moraniibacteriota bacterium]
MALQDLNEDLHQHDFKSDRDMRTIYDPGDTRKDRLEQVDFHAKKWDETQIPVRKTVMQRFFEFSTKHWRWYVAGIFLLTVTGFIFNFSFFGSFLFSGDRVAVTVEGPTEVASGVVVSYTVHWENRNMLGASNAQVMIQLPDTFRMDPSEGFSVNGNTATASVGTIGNFGSGQLKFSGKFYGSKGELSYLHPKIRFSPAGLSIVYESESQTGVTIASSPLFLEVVGPLEAASGNDVTYDITYRNDSDVAYSNLRLVTEYPEGFEFRDADPRPIEGDSKWRIGNLAPGQSGKIQVHGILGGDSNQGKVMYASIGVLQGDGSFVTYEKKERLIRMVVSPLRIVQKVNGKADLSANQGDLLAYELTYKNQGDVGLRNVIVTLDVDATLLDMTMLRLNNQGSFDVAKSRITWTAADFPGLAYLGPNEGGTITFMVPVKANVATTGQTGKYPTIKTTAKIDSPDVPFTAGQNKIIVSSSLEVRIGSTVEFSVLGFNTDTAIPNTGPIPPKVGQETTYMLRISATNYLNDLAGTKVTMTLPTGSRYTGKFLPEDSSLDYNERTRQLIWDIGSLPGGGRVSRDLSVQVAITPGPDQINQAPELLQSAILDARDTFTDGDIHLTLPGKTTDLKEDKGIPWNGYSVVP